MWKGIVLVGMALPLAGCAGGFMRASQEECGKMGFALGTQEYLNCVNSGFDRREARLDRIRAGLAAASAANAASMPPPPPPPAMQPMQPIQRAPVMRTLRRSYIDGLNRICLYDTMYGTEIVTIASVQLCPIA